METDSVNNLLLFLSLVANIVGIISAIAAALAWLQSRATNERLKLEDKRQNEKIRVIMFLETGEDLPIELPAAIRRRDLTRSELLGRIGMIKPGPRYDISALNTRDFIETLDTIAVSKGPMTLKIPLSQDEYDHFKST